MGWWLKSLLGLLKRICGCGTYSSKGTISAISIRSSVFVAASVLDKAKKKVFNYI